MGSGLGFTGTAFAADTRVGTGLDWAHAADGLPNAEQHRPDGDSHPLGHRHARRRCIGGRWRVVEAFGQEATDERVALRALVMWGCGDVERVGESRTDAPGPRLVYRY